MADRSSPALADHQRGSVQETPDPSDKNPANLNNGAPGGRRKACNQCRQQKLRCDLAAAEIEGQAACGRCRRLDLECKIDNGFQRTRKRRRSADYEDEIRALKSRLDGSQQGTAITSPPLVTEPLPRLNLINQEPQVQLGTVGMLQEPIYATNDINLYNTPGTVDRPGSVAALSISSSIAHAASAEASRTHAAPGLTTIPDPEDTAVRPPRTSFSAPRPRAVGNVVLSVEEVHDLFKVFQADYQHFLPIVDLDSHSPHELYEISDLLFWSIVSVAARRLKAQPTLLPKLARSVTDLLWRTVRSMPHSVETVQSLALLCTWPFPTSSSSTDPTFMLAGLMLQIGTQMGLHRAQYAQDFAKAPLNLGSEDITCWRRIWEWCTVVAQSVSIGCGFPLPLQQPDAERTTPTSHGGSNSESTRDFRRRLELFRDRVSSSLTPNVRSSGEQAASPERLILYRLLGADLLELSQPGASRMELDAWHLAAARVHLHAFYLFDHASTPGYQDFICTTYLSARALISSTLALDARQPRGFLEHCPFSCYQVFVCASVIVLKILFNGFFRTLLDDVDEGTKLIEGAIAALRKMSVMNNDLPARLGGVIGFFCALPDMTAIGGTTMHDLQLKHVTNRLSMSVVYDCLWTWRRHFIAMDRGDRRQDDVASFETNGQAGASDDFGDVQGMLGFDFALESWDFLA